MWIRKEMLTSSLISEKHYATSIGKRKKKRKANHKIVPNQIRKRFPTGETNSE